MTLRNLSNFITTRLGSVKEWAACNSLDWVTWIHLHFTLAYIVNRRSQTRQAIYIHVQYGVHGEMYNGIDSRLIELSLSCIICNQIKNVFGCFTRCTNSLSPEQAAVHRVFPCWPTRQHPLALVSPKWADNLVGRGVERMLMKNPGVGRTLKNLSCVDCTLHRLLN